MSSLKRPCMPNLNSYCAVSASPMETTHSPLMFLKIPYTLLLPVDGTQGHSEGTSSVAFEVLIISCQIYFLNLCIFNCLTLYINLFIFNCLTSNFCFPKNISFANRRERLFRRERHRRERLCLWTHVLSFGF